MVLNIAPPEMVTKKQQGEDHLFYRQPQTKKLAVDSIDLYRAIQQNMLQGSIWCVAKEHAVCCKSTYAVMQEHI